MKIHVSLLNKDTVCQKQVIIVTTWCQLYTSKKDIFILVCFGGDLVHEFWSLQRDGKWYVHRKGLISLAMTD